MNGTLFLQNREKILKKWKLEIGHIKNPIVGLVPENKRQNKRQKGGKSNCKLKVYKKLLTY